MLRLRTLFVLAAVTAATAAALASAAAAPGIRLFSPHAVHLWHGGERQAVWRDHDRDFWRRDHRDQRDRGDFVGPVDPAGSFDDEADELGPEAAPLPLFLPAPVFVDGALAPGVGPAPVEWARGPKIIEIGRSAPPRRHLPVVIYGD